MQESNTLAQQLEAAAGYMRERLDDEQPQILLVLGSGLNHVANLVSDPIVVPFGEVPHLCESTVKEHAGKFVYGMLGGKRVLVMQGRLHGY